MVTPVESVRRVLCVYPRHANGFPNFTYAFKFFPDVKALMPPQGLLIIAAYLPARWEVRFVDENVRRATDADYQWADVIMASGTHNQRHLLRAVAERAHAFGKLAVLGGPSVSACPEFYPEFDALHIGELGDGTDELIAALDRGALRPRAPQAVFTTTQRLPLEAFPIPAYRLMKASNYLLMSIQWSSGCPYTCEFCDIPELYGRVPRYKSPERLLAELDAIAAEDPLGAVFFVDDNLIGDKKAFKQLLPHLIAWQKRNGYRLRLVGECTLNIAQDEAVLGMMREAFFTELFIGVESPEEDALVAMSKKQNLRMPMLDAVRVINAYGIGIVAGIIIGLDTDTDETVDRLLSFIELSKIPMVVVNLLYAPPKTPLYRRLEAEGRLSPRSSVVDSNVVFAAPPEVVHGRWRRALLRALEPEAVFERFRHNVRETYSKRIKPPLNRSALSWPMVRNGLSALGAAFYYLGVESSSRREFWALAIDLLRSGEVDVLIYLASISYHLIRFREDVISGDAQACIHTEAAGSGIEIDASTEPPRASGVERLLRIRAKPGRAPSPRL